MFDIEDVTIKLNPFKWTMAVLLQFGQNNSEPRPNPGSKLDSVNQLAS